MKAINHIGKKYKNEKAIISLTSWKARINTVSKTLYSLLQQCPGFHIVLVLSEEEFPKKEEELPENLRLFIDNDLIEVLWVYKNYKSLKKILFTMHEYPDVPVISADDDNIYTCNYAEDLYQTWIKNKECLITVFPYKLIHRTAGPSTLYFPKCFGDFDVFTELENNSHLDIYEHADDGFYEMLRGKYKNPKIISLVKQVFISHDTTKPLGQIYGQKSFMQNLRLAQNDDIHGNIFEFIGND